MAIPIDIIVWLAAIILFIVLEAATVALVSIWFIFGSVAALISAILGAPGWLQVVLFLLVSVVALAVTRPIVQKRLVSKKVNTNADRVLEQNGTVTQTIDNIAGTGIVRVNGVDWTARSDSGDIIPEGVLVSTLRIEGVKLYVTPAKQLVTK